MGQNTDAAYENMTLTEFLAHIQESDVRTVLDATAARIGAESPRGSDRTYVSQRMKDIFTRWLEAYEANGTQVF